MQKFQNILSLSPNHCSPLRDTKTSEFFFTMQLSKVNLNPANKKNVASMNSVQKIVGEFNCERAIHHPQ